MASAGVRWVGEAPAIERASSCRLGEFHLAGLLHLSELPERSLRGHAERLRLAKCELCDDVRGSLNRWVRLISPCKPPGLVTRRRSG